MTFKPPASSGRALGGEYSLHHFLHRMLISPLRARALNEKAVVEVSHEALTRCWRRIASPKARIGETSEQKYYRERTAYPQSRNMERTDDPMTSMDEVALA